MFPNRTAKRFAQRALGALGTARSFLLLEDDTQLDWEVDWERRADRPHPHRTPLRGRFVRRRAGQPEAARQVCMTPVGGLPGWARAQACVARRPARGCSGGRELDTARGRAL